MSEILTSSILYEDSNPLNGVVEGGQEVVGSISSTCELTGTLSSEVALVGDIYGDTQLNGEFENQHTFEYSLSSAYDVTFVDGGYYIPSVEDGELEWTPSKPSMPEVPSSIIKGKDGIDGQDGVSPIVSISSIEGGNRITVTDIDGEKHVDIMNGIDGIDGSDGVSVTHIWNDTILTITSASGTSSVDLKGKDGEDGYIPIKGIDYVDGVGIKSVRLNDDYTLTIIFDNENTYTTPSIRGEIGPKGEDGYTPQKGIDYFDGKDGTMSFEDLTDEQKESLKGDPGKDGYTPQKNIDYFDGKDGAPGKDGTSVTHAWDGTTLTITSASGTSSADLKGEPGKDGYTPQKNIDYFDGKDGKDGEQGIQGIPGEPGIQGPRGERGEPFFISKVYSSVNAMHLSYATDDVPEGGFVVIDTGDVDDEDNAKLFYKGVTQYEYLTDLSGAQGIQGPAGEPGIQGVPGIPGQQGIQGIQGEPGRDGKAGVDGITPHIGDNGNWFVGDSDTGNPSRGEAGLPGKDGYTPQKNIDYFDGNDGEDGVGIKSVTQTTTSTADGGSNVVTVTKTDNTTSTFTVKNGSKGSKGDPGADGSTFWTSTTAPTTPNYTFQIANLNSPLNDAVKVGDIILYSYYRYTVTSVDGDTVLTGSRVSLRGAAGAAGKAADVYTAVWSNKWTTPPKGTWEITLYKNGAVCEDTVYAEFLYATSLSEEPTTASSQTGSFTGTKSWTGSTPYKYLINFYEDDTKAKLLHSEMLAPNAFDKNALVDLLHHVGSVYITNTNTNPGDTLGGTWELINKSFKPVQGNSTSTFFTKNTDNLETATVYYRRAGNTIWIKFYFKTNVALSEDSVALGSFNLDKLGVTAMSSHALTSIPFTSDGGDGMALVSITTAGVASSIDVVKKGSTTSIASGSTLYGFLTLVFRPSDMLDEYCNQFHWQRTE